MQTYQTPEEVKEEFETMFPDAILTTRTETVVGTYDETDETKRFKRWFLSKLQAREEWLVSQVKKLETFREKHVDDSVGPQCVRLDQVLSLIKK